MKRFVISRLMLLILAISMAVGMIHAQRSASDAAFGRGVELYGLRKYAEAIPFFEKADSLDALYLPEGSSMAMYPSMWIANCYYKMGNEEKAQEIAPYSYMLPPVDRRLTVESDSLTDLFYQRIELGDMNGALDAIVCCGEIEKSVLGADSYYYANTLSAMAEFYASMGDYDTALMKWKEALKIYRNNAYDYGMANCYWLIGQISTNIDGEELETAFGYFQLSKDKFSTIGCKTEVANLLVSMANLKCQIGEYGDAYELCMEAKEAVEKDNLFSDMLEAYADMLSVTAQTEIGLLMFDEAFSHATEAKEMYEQIALIDFYGYLLNEYYRTYASLYASGCDHRAVIKEAYKTFINLGKYISDPLLQKCVERLYLRCNPDDIPLEQLIARQRKLLQELEEIEGYRSSNYLEVLADILNEYESVSDTDIQEIMSLYDEIQSLKSEMRGMDFWGSVSLQRDISFIEYGIMGDADKAITTLKDRIDSIRQGGWQYVVPFPYCQLLNQIAQFYISIDQYYEAYEYLHEAIEIYAFIEEGAETFDISHSDVYISTLEQMAIYYINSGNAMRADECVERLRELDPDAIENDATLFTYQLYSVGNSSMEDEEKARKVEQMLIGRLNSMEKTDDEDLSYSMLSLFYASLLAAEGRTDEATGLIKEVLERAEADYGDIALVMIPVEIACAQAMMYNGSLSEAKELLIKALSKTEQTQVIPPQFIASAYQSLTDIYSNEGRYEEALPCITKILKIYKDVLNSNFLSMSYKERCALWDKFSNWFTIVLPTVAYRGKSHEMDCELFDGLLMSKGYLLNSEIELRKLVVASGDEYSEALYDEVQKLYTQQKNATDNPQEYARITREIENKERELATSVKAFGDYTKNLTLTWKDVNGVLSSDGAAIEFVVTSLSSDEIVYSALVLKADAEPYRVDLCTQNQLITIPIDSLYITTELSDLIWKPLEEGLKDVKDVYFSPQGLLYSTAIEYAPTNDGYISDRYNLYRLSSTREIVLPHDQSNAKSAVLYGGLSYSADTTAVIKANSGQVGLDVFKPRVALENLRDVGPQGISDLAYTLEEVEQIDSLHLAVQEDCHLFKGIYGTEESFKSLSGTGKTLLHLATHGFYYTQTDYANKNSFLTQAIGMLDEKLISTEDKMLTRSGLFLTGVNTVLTNQSIPNTMEDGILTAQEIAFLDFRDVDLVVLSACKSAMGELVGDGVFGLQRGFKKAGAKTLLMSLWNVDDRATKLLMTEFYKNWLGAGSGSGKMSKREAFLKAQEYLRTTEGGKYKDPKYWAAFIMLDGIN